MRRIAAATACLAIVSGTLCTAAPAQADHPDPAPQPSDSAGIQQFPNPLFWLHPLDREPHMGPHGLRHSVRTAHRPTP